MGDLYDRIRQSMPPTDPGAVQAATKVDIVAYLLKGNKMPAGGTELPKEVDGLKQIEYPGEQTLKRVQGAGCRVQGAVLSAGCGCRVRGMIADS